MTGGLGRLARSPEEMGINMAAAMARALVHYAPYAPEPGDVFITSWAKSGTTLMQQMFHQIRMVAATGAGDMDFDDISRMTPWDDTARMTDTDMTAPQRASPRGFKSHREYERLAQGMRYVVTLREPKDTYVSIKRFFEGWMVAPGALSLEEFMPFWMSGGPGGCDYFTHLLSWWARRDEPDTLLMTYEATARDRRRAIRRLAAFMGIEPTDTLIEIVDGYTTREFMHAHKDRFDDAMMVAALREGAGIEHELESSKVQAIGSDGSSLPASIAEQIDAMWAERVEPVTGMACYADLAAEVDALAGAALDGAARAGA
ncbi:MAG: sulfotransferase domain-containing protein [Pseudomonadota bacterium]|nr:sulfotransferase domain-containing protein [Pseudomonadota bacterium]